MKTKSFFLAVMFIFSTASFAGTTFHTDEGVEALEVGDSVYVCSEDACHDDAEVVQKVVLKDASKSSIEQALRNARKLAVPGMALVVLTSLPTADGGPITGVVCAIACEVVSNIGCGAGAWITATLNPAVGICYAAVCTALNSGAVTSCAAYCAALPTP